MAGKRKVLVTATNYSKYCSEAKKMLEEKGFEVIENPFGRPFTFPELEKVIHEISAVVAGVDTWNQDVFKMAPKLKVIARFGVGIDNIDLKKAKEYGIKVTNAKGRNANAVAEMTVGLILAAIRNIPYLNHSLRQGNWDRFVGIEMAGKHLGLLGFGAIGQLVAAKLRGFDLQVFAFDKYPQLEKAKHLGVSMAAMEDILRQSDIVSLHLPSTEETYHVLGKEQFAMMKDGAYLINTARGSLVDEKALYEALISRKLGAAAIDVYEEEPARPTHPLLRLDNIVVTPHTAAETYETYASVSRVTAQAIIDVFEGRSPENLLNG